MNIYKKILIAQNCVLSFDSEVGLFLNQDTMRLIGEAFLYNIKGRIFADITSEIDADEYYPKVLFIGNRIDSIVLDKVKGSQPVIKRIKEQVLINL